MYTPSRREFLKSAATTACSAGLSACGFAEVFAASRASRSALATPPAALPIKKGVLLDMLPAKLSYADRMKMARDVGFEVIQAPTTPDEHGAEEIKKAADSANVRIDSVMNMDHWKYPLSSSDPGVVEKSLGGMRTSLRNAKLWGSDGVLLVPAVVNPQTSYRDAWTRSQREDRKSTRLNSSHSQISYAVFCLKKKKNLHHTCVTMNKVLLTAESFATPSGTACDEITASWAPFYALAVHASVVTPLRRRSLAF